jgi:hypothetical protein
MDRFCMRFAEGGREWLCSEAFEKTWVEANFGKARFKAEFSPIVLLRSRSESVPMAVLWLSLDDCRLWRVIVGHEIYWVVSEHWLSVYNLRGVLTLLSEWWWSQLSQQGWGSASTTVFVVMGLYSSGTIAWFLLRSVLTWQCACRYGIWKYSQVFGALGWGHSSWSCAIGDEHESSHTDFRNGLVACD